MDLEKIVQGKQGNLNVVEDGECAMFTSRFLAERYSKGVKEGGVPDLI